MMVYRSLPHTDKGTIHLYSTGIQPKLKGQGLMSDPFKNSFLYFKNLGYQKVALETSDYSNVGLYEHIGFKLVFTKKSKDERQEIFYFEKVL
jgi:predicted GNAT family acetyltransferase